MSVTAHRVKGKTFYNQKLYGANFIGQDLVHADFRSATLMNANFTDADLSYANFEGANCRGAIFDNCRLYRANFKDAALAGSVFRPKDAFGITLTMACETFDDVQSSGLWYLSMVMLALRMKSPEEGLEEKIISAIGTERYMGLRHIFDRRVF